MTVLGLVPTLASSGVGAETQRPLATVVIGRLITSTLLTLLPPRRIYEWPESRAEAWQRKQEAAEDAEQGSIVAFTHPIEQTP